ATAMIHPGILLADVQAEGQGGVERKGRILADVVIVCRMAAFDSARLHCIENLQAGNDFTAGKDTDLEFAIGRGFDPFGDDFTGAEDGVEALRETGRHAPVDFRHALGKSRSRETTGSTQAAGRTGQSGTLEEFTSLHLISSPLLKLSA